MIREATRCVFDVYCKACGYELAVGLADPDDAPSGNCPSCNRYQGRREELGRFTRTTISRSEVYTYEVTSRVAARPDDPQGLVLGVDPLGLLRRDVVYQLVRDGWKIILEPLGEVQESPVWNSPVDVVVERGTHLLLPSESPGNPEVRAAPRGEKMLALIREAEAAVEREDWETGRKLLERLKEAVGNEPDRAVLGIDWSLP